MDELKFTCPKCAHDRIDIFRTLGTARCKACQHTGKWSEFRLEKRPGLHWDEARENRAPRDE